LSTNTYSLLGAGSQHGPPRHQAPRQPEPPRLATPGAQSLAAALARKAWPPGCCRCTEIVGAPVLRPDGTLLQEGGYDERTGLYLASRIALDPVPAEPRMLSGDMATRTILVRLYPNMPRPEERTGFKIPNLDHWILDPAHQRLVLWHLLILVIDWTRSGAPRQAGVTMRQFTPWAEAIGGFLAHHGIGGFLADIETVRDIDDEDATWTAFLARWRKVIGRFGRHRGKCGGPPRFPGSEMTRGTACS
jgi:hypothetical protein